MHLTACADGQLEDFGVCHAHLLLGQGRMGFRFVGAGKPVLGDAMADQYQDYLQRASEADANAGLAGNAQLKRQWREIANGYRNLAQLRLDLFPSAAALKLPPP